MTKSKDIKNSIYAGIELNELLNNYNEDRDQQAILMRNFNEIDTPPARIEGAASGGGNPHKLSNKKSKFEGMSWEVGERRGDYSLDKEKVSQNASNAKIEVL